MFFNCNIKSNTIRVVQKQLTGNFKNEMRLSIYKFDKVFLKYKT